MCTMVFHSLLNFTHIIQWFRFVPNPSVVAYSQCHRSFVERGSCAADLAHPKILAWHPAPFYLDLMLPVTGIRVRFIFCLRETIDWCWFCFLQEVDTRMQRSSCVFWNFTRWRLHTVDRSHVVVKWVVVRVFMWITGIGDHHKRQTRATCGCVALGQSPWARAWDAAWDCTESESTNQQ